VHDFLPLFFGLEVWVECWGICGNKKLTLWQSRSWDLSMLSAVLQGLTVLTLLLTFERMTHKKRLTMLREGSEVCAA